MKHIYKCSNCSRYTMKEVCSCGSAALPAKPLKYTPNDKFSSYRRKAKISQYKDKGLL